MALRPARCLGGHVVPAYDLSRVIAVCEASDNADEPAPEADATAESDAADKLAEIRAERERIEKENQRKTDEYNDKVKKAKDKVNDLNFRFANWYYVISEDMYKKIHLSRSDIVKESEESKEGGFGMDAFEKIRTDGQEILNSN